jgi:hypothetical protein
MEPATRLGTRRGSNKNRPEDPAGGTKEQCKGIISAATPIVKIN